MKLILRADVDSLGRLGDIVTVKAGYGRNYLIPQGLAKPATNANLKAFELERRKLQEHADSLRAQAEGLADRIAANPVEIAVRVGDGDKLYGSVTTSNIGDAMEAAGVDIDRRKILLAEPIRALGEYEIEIRLHPDVLGVLKLAVIRHGRPVEEIKEPEAKEAEAVEESVENAEDAETTEA
ncbi:MULTISPECIES: 50S ribosomal protein L9 [unclassified Pseudodesulfovibrio]|uniref:50S ribosomal protein L9 n=1 Tax=unclassified Pseudodesulfovibrio TaxID=2661612 RepID=UPI000FEB675D|nr:MULTISPECIES: 50S ribosomal protein L9 [unclassified Pseudodesulfovibrio]MCJ2164279.1 50S ribosomal protein L9 [Pseudodesulfovibrio sp. S3-i]RWU05099.1 50S ribosomal protein L9 [Pseudodesulfovibrio sp. S3]